MPVSTRLYSVAALCLLTASLALLTGCAASFDPMEDATAVQTPIGHIRGAVYGGRTPITSAELFLFQTANTGYGATTAYPVTAASTASTSLINTTAGVVNGTACTGCTQDTTAGSPTLNDYYVTTGATDGSFNLNGTYTCTSGTWVYIYARQGITLTAQNPQIGEMALLGQCPSTGTLAGTLSYIYMNEVSTVAMAYALGGFEFDPTHIGTSSTNAVGLNNAAANALQIYNLFLAPSSSSYGAGANTTTTPYVSKLTVTGGTGYTVAPTVTIASPPNGGIKATATATITSGAPVLTITNPGTNYTVGSAPAVTLSGGTYTTAATAAATVTAGNGTIPTALVNTVANIIVSCINSAETATVSTTACNKLRAYATYDGGTGTLVTAPTATGYSADAPLDTAVAAINIARHPGNNVANLFGAIASGPGAVYNGGLSSAPNDFGVDINYTTAATASAVQEPHGLAVDASGNLWRTSYVTSAGSVTKTGPQGGAIFSLTSGMSGPVSVAIDTSGNAVVANYSNSSLTKVNSSGVAVVGSPFSNSNMVTPTDAEIDAAGNIWTANESAKVTAFTPTGSLFANISGAGVLKYVWSVAITAGTSGNVWLPEQTSTANYGYTLLYTPISGAGGFSGFTGLTTSMFGSAIDGSGNIWVTFTSTYGFVGNTAHGLTFSLNTNVQNAIAPIGVSIDGAGGAWFTDSGNGAIYEYNNPVIGTTTTYTTLSPTYGYLPPGNTACSSTSCTRTTEPDAIAVDNSGNVWYTDTTTSLLHEKVGIAFPVVTPLAAGVTNSTLGARP